MRTSWTTAVLAAALATAPACDPASILRGSDAPGSTLETDGASFQLVEQWEGAKVTIPIEFTNPYDASVYIVNCNGTLAPALQRRVDGRWVHALSSVVPQCLSPPIVIPAGQAFAATVEMWGSYPGTNAYPQWPSAQLDGEYRLVLHNLVFDYDPDGFPFGPEVPLAVRTSKPFQLIQP